MHDAGVFLILGGAGLIGYTYILYPILLKIVSVRNPAPATLGDPDAWPAVTIILTIRNEATQIAQALEGLLALDYPKARMQILVISPDSADGTHEIVQAYADRGVEWVGVPDGRPSGAAALTASPYVRGDVVVNTDTAVRVPPEALKALIRPFTDPSVGLTTGRAIRLPSDAQRSYAGDVAAMRYGSAIRSLESRAGSLVGDAGPCYAIRAHLHRVPLPASLSRATAAALHCREWGYRAVLVAGADYYVPGAGSLSREYRQRVGTLARELRTVLHKRRHLNPFRGVGFAWMIFSHEVCRWIVPWAGVFAVAGLAVAAPTVVWARILLGIVGAMVTLGALGWAASGKRSLYWFLEIPAFGLMEAVALMHGALRASRREHGTARPAHQLMPR